MSQTYIGLIVTLLAVFLPKFGVQIGSDELTNVVSSIVTIIGGLWAFWGRYRVGDITPFGMKK